MIITLKQWDILKNDLIRLAEEKDFLQLVEMKWEYYAEDDITYGETNIVGVDKKPLPYAGVYTIIFHI